MFIQVSPVAFGRAKLSVKLPLGLRLEASEKESEPMTT